jgi:FkbM family methyltransferase
LPTQRPETQYASEQMNARTLASKALERTPRLKHLVKETIRILRSEPPIFPGALGRPDLPGLLGRLDPVILDIGCNDGTHSLMFLDVFPHARVYSFEPDPRAQTRFRAQVNDPRARLFEFAIGDSNGPVNFHMSDGAPNDQWRAGRPDGWDLSGSIRKPKEHSEVAPWCRFDREITVEVRRLDSWAEEEQIQRIDLIWADVQGAEIDLIRGAERVLAKTRFFYTEYSNRELYEGQVNLRQLMKMLPQFELVRRYPADVLFRNILLR